MAWTRAFARWSGDWAVSIHGAQVCSPWALACWPVAAAISAARTAVAPRTCLIPRIAAGMVRVLPCRARRLALRGLARAAPAPLGSGFGPGWHPRRIREQQGQDAALLRRAERRQLRGRR